MNRYPLNELYEQSHEVLNLWRPPTAK
jgi:hypothetical protein